MKACPPMSYSWSLPSGVLENVDALAEHPERRGHETRVTAPNDLLDPRTRLPHPKLACHGGVPKQVIPVGRSVPLPSNGPPANPAFSTVV